VVVVAPLHDGDREGVATMVGALAAGRPVTWSIDPSGWQVIAEAAPSSHPAALVAPAWSAQLRSGPTHMVHVIGAGHVGSALAPLLLALDFRVVVVDERPGLASLAADTEAHERVVRPYEELADVVCPGPTSFAAIMTHSHERDAVALAALEPLELGYLGLLGSLAKVRRIVGDRVMPAWFHAPLGLRIGSATPAEIAVSIAAEMVSVRSAARRDTT
jgi:xanthine dehydrogenase accessory factor